MAQSFTIPKVIAQTTQNELSAFGEQRTTMLTPVAGWTFSYNIISDLVSTSSVGTGSVTQSSSRAKLTTIGAGSESKLLTRKSVRYIPGCGSLVRFTCVWETAPTNGNFRICGIGNTIDGFFFGTSGSSYGIIHRVNSIDTFYTQSSWSENTCPWLNITKGNVYQISYQWLGYGEIKFMMEDPATGIFTPVHKIKYANTSASASMLNPNMPIKAHNYNTFATGAFVMYTPSAMGFVENSESFTPLSHDPLCVSRQIAFSANSITTETVVLVMENSGSLNGITNRMVLDMGSLNMACDGTKMVDIKIIRNPTLGGATPVYSNVFLNQSPVRYSTTAGITYSGGTIKYAATMMKLDRINTDLKDWLFELLPGENLVITIQSTANVDIDGAVQWFDKY